jgi:hypothetical protein
MAADRTRDKAGRTGVSMAASRDKTALMVEGDLCTVSMDGGRQICETDGNDGGRQN